MATKKSSPETNKSMDADNVFAKLKEFGASDDMVAKIKDDLGVESIDDLGLVNEGDLISAGLKTIQARKLLASLSVAPVVVSTPAEVPPFASFNDNILPSVPDDGSWLESLKAGGVLKVDQSTVISAVRAALAHRVGLYEVPAKLVSAMEDFAEKNEDPVDSSFFSLKKQLTRRNYAEIFSAVDGLDGNYVTEAAKKKFFNRMDSAFFPAIINFFEQLKSWQNAWVQGASNPAVLMAAITGHGAALPTMMQAPDTGALRDYGDAVANAINKAFAGTGVQITAALAYDAVQIKKTLADSRLPSLVGAANREQMLRQIGAAVSSTYPRLETNLTKFVLATIQAREQPSGNEELQYFGSLFMLGSQIQWDQIGLASGITGIGGHKL